MWPHKQRNTAETHGQLRAKIHSAMSRLAYGLEPEPEVEEPTEDEQAVNAWQALDRDKKIEQLLTIPLSKDAKNKHHEHKLKTEQAAWLLAFRALTFWVSIFHSHYTIVLSLYDIYTMVFFDTWVIPRGPGSQPRQSWIATTGSGALEGWSRTSSKLRRCSVATWTSPSCSTFSRRPILYYILYTIYYIRYTIYYILYSSPNRPGKFKLYIET